MPEGCKSEEEVGGRCYRTFCSLFDEAVSQSSHLADKWPIWDELGYFQFLSNSWERRVFSHALMLSFHLPQSFTVIFHQPSEAQNRESQTVAAMQYPAEFKLMLHQRWCDSFEAATKSVDW